MLDPREQQKGGFRAFAEREAQRREDRAAVSAAVVDTAGGTTTDPVPATAAADAPVYGPRLVADTPDR